MYMKNEAFALADSAEQDTELLSLYPVDMSFFKAQHYEISSFAIPFVENGTQVELCPVTITRYALAQWNAYLQTGEVPHCHEFLAQAQWLVEHETRIGGKAGGWPHTFSSSQVRTESHCLSATIQGTALSILLRAYQLTHEEQYAVVAERAYYTFELDILDGGIGTPVGDTGVFFEEAAVYPATHALHGCLFALIGLVDYKYITKTSRADCLIRCGMTALHLYIDAYDTGYWTYTDLLQYKLASPIELALQIHLLDTLSHLVASELCATFAARWREYAKQPKTRWRYKISNIWQHVVCKLMRRIHSKIFPSQYSSHTTRVCIALTAFPVTGGIRAVVSGIAKVMADTWDIEYLTHSIGPNSQELPISIFGTKSMAAWQFPNVWFYVAAGYRKMLSLLHLGASYHIILPQDGIFTSLFAALAGKFAGVRVVCIDHGSLTLLNSATYRVERSQAMTRGHSSNMRVLLSLLRYHFYFPSLAFFASISAHMVDHFLIPGVAGDSIEEACKSLGIHASRITRFNSMVDIGRHEVPDTSLCQVLRAQKGIPPDAVLVAMVCRLAPEKGIDSALEAIDLAYHALAVTHRSHLRVVIAGDGPLRAEVAEDIARRGLSTTCLLWGELFPQEVIALLGISDIFLYASRRGACFSMAILEAMASRCAVIASTEPLSNAHLLADGRGIALSTNDAQQMADSLICLVSNRAMCMKMGQAARDYVATQHSVAMFRRTLLRVTRWANLDELIDSSTSQKSEVMCQ